MIESERIFLFAVTNLSSRGMIQENLRSGIVICDHQYVNAPILVDQFHTAKSSGKADGLYTYNHDAEYTTVSRLFVEFGNCSCSMRGLLEG